MAKRKDSEKAGGPPIESGGFGDLIYKTRSTRYVVNGLRAQVAGLADGLDGRTKVGQKLKPTLHEVHLALALATNRLATVLREFGESVDGDPC